ncbi:hypothetical protein [Hymenobacter sp. IS2118]|uniref:hypothetical protein n=1 Tax=Hymenobacter sp. IS2118 TaxID=1505605 RepID=UPI000555A9D6|nr:hypothetical protein [Hymenobacter sp. IS2118]
MPYSPVAPAAKKSAYQRPYKSRRQRREVDRRKHDEAKGSRFLIRFGIAIAILVTITVTFAVTGLSETGNESARTSVRK